jgi:hypothetical protein
MRRFDCRKIQGLESGPEASPRNSQKARQISIFGESLPFVYPLIIA